ncbi:MAG: biopolymer transporter ExbD [Bacteroidetes bacterium]|jgi:biopolymer transport protein ExbD|nr:biopolymer transporter ExbD [Bacteroidota bacterium]
MAEVNTGDGGEAKKGKPKKHTLRVDFTPMVDMNMLLITFFMFCTTLSKPQAMDLILPTKDEVKKEDKNKVEDTKAITVILGEKNKVYYYFGKPNYTDPNSLALTNYGPQGLRKMLIERNAVLVNRMRKLRDLKAKKQISEDDFKKQSKEIKNDDAGQVVIIKPTDGATYSNLVDVLDEMQICSIGKYAIVDLTEGDKYLVQNLETGGSLSKQAASK